MRLIQRLALAAVMTLAGAAALANPTRCAGGYQDSSCSNVLLNGPQAAPTCSNAPGWTTGAPAKWAGSKWTAPTCNYAAPASCSSDPGWTTTTPAAWDGSSWSAPACNYTAAPTCPANYDQTAAPSWNGSSWVGLGCQAKALPPPPASPLFAQPITVAAEYGMYFTVGSIIQISSTATTVTLANLNPKPNQSGSCTISLGQTCYWGFSTGVSPDPYGLNAADIFSQCALDYSWHNNGTFFAATLNGDHSLTITAISIVNTSGGWSDSTNYFNYAVIPANYSSGSFRLPLDSYNTTGSGTGGRCWPNTGGGGG